MRTYSRPPRLRGAVTTVVALSLLVLPAGAGWSDSTAAPTAAPTQGITGLLSSSAGPVEGFVRVEPVDRRDTTFHVGVNWGTSDGGFDVRLEPGRYWVQFVPGTRGLSPEWWGDAVTRGTSTIVTVEPGLDTVLDPVLDPGGAIDGKVTSVTPRSGSTDATVELWAVDPAAVDGHDLIQTTVAAADGTFSLPELHSGRYWVRASTGSTHLEGWWRTGEASATTLAEATPVDVTAPAGVTGIDLQGLHPKGTVSGTLQRADGRPLAGVGIRAYRRLPDGTWRQSDSVGTDARGHYLVPLLSGVYRLASDGSTDDHTSFEFWDHAATVDDARDVAVTVGDNRVVDHVAEPTTVIPQVPATLTGTRRVGSTLRVTGGTWYPSRTAVTCQWLREGRPIAGAVGCAYRLRPADLGSTVTVRLAGRAAGYETTTTTAGSPYDDVSPGRLSALTRPSVTGRARVGALLRAVAPRTRPAAAATYQWRRNGYVIRGATGRTYRVVARDRDDFLSVTIEKKPAGYVPVAWLTELRRQVH